MKNLLKYITVSLALSAIGACTNIAEPYDAIFITEAQKSVDKVLVVDTTPAVAEFSVSASVKAKNDVKISLEVRPDLLDAYNKKYAKNYQMAPQGTFELSATETTIKAGFALSDNVTLKVTSLDGFEEGVTYCIPVNIQSVSSMQVLEPSRTLYLVLKTPVISKAIYLGYNKYLIPGFQEDENLSALPQATFEARVNVSRFCGSDPYISSIMGIEGMCGIRFGDVKVPNNCLQICHDSYQPAATNNLFDTDKWYHVAAVWTGSTWDIYIDGLYITGATTAGETLDLTSDNSGGFWFGASYGGGRPLEGYLAEVRVWSRALSQAEIANNMNYVKPDSDGLLAYWRMNSYKESDRDGYGNMVLDETGHGYHAYGVVAKPTMIDTKWK